VTFSPVGHLAGDLKLQQRGVQGKLKGGGGLVYPGTCERTYTLTKTLWEERPLEWERHGSHTGFVCIGEKARETSNAVNWRPGENPLKEVSRGHELQIETLRQEKLGLDFFLEMTKRKSACSSRISQQKGAE